MLVPGIQVIKGILSRGSSECRALHMVEEQDEAAQIKEGWGERRNDQLLQQAL